MYYFLWFFTLFVIPLQLFFFKYDEECHKAVNKLEANKCSIPKLNYKNKSSDVFIIDSKIEELICEFTGKPYPSKVWITPKNLIKYMNFAENKVNFITENSKLIGNQTIFELNSKITQEEYRRFKLNSQGNLYILNISRYDSGVYTCLGFNQFGNVTSYIPVRLDTSFLYETKRLHDILGCSIVSVFFIFIYIIRKAIIIAKRYFRKRQDLPENGQVYTMMESIENYKTQQLEKLRDNYNQQVLKIKENGVQQLEWIQQSYQTQARHVKDFKTYGTNQITNLKDQYYDQIKRVRDYSTSQMNSIRENYVLQRNKVQKFSTHQIIRLRESYKIQQLNLNKVLNNISNCNFETCREISQSECSFEKGIKNDYEIIKEYNNFDSKTSLYFTPKEVSEMMLDIHDDKKHENNLRELYQMCEYTRNSIQELKTTNSCENIKKCIRLIHQRSFSLPNSFL